MTDGLVEECLLKRLTPEQARDVWPLISDQLVESLPERNRDENSGYNMLYSILTDRADLWIYWKDANKPEPRPAGAVVTAFVYDQVFKQVSIGIYCLVSFETVGVTDMRKALDTLIRYAKNKNVGGPISFVSNRKIRILLQRMGFEPMYEAYNLRES